MKERYGMSRQISNFGKQVSTQLSSSSDHKGSNRLWNTSEQVTTSKCNIWNISNVIGSICDCTQ